MKKIPILILSAIFVFGLFNIQNANALTLSGGISTRTSLGLSTSDSPTFSGLTLDSTIGFLLLNRMTTTQRDALTPVNGMQIYNTTTGKFQSYEAGSWQDSIPPSDFTGTGIDNRYGLFNGTDTLEGGLLSDNGTNVNLTSGKFGIGIAIPGQELDVASTNPTIRLSDTDSTTSSDSQGLIEWYSPLQPRDNALLGFIGGGTFQIEHKSVGNLVLVHTGSPAITIISDGKVGIGNASSPTEALQVGNGNLGFSSGAGAADVILARDAANILALKNGANPQEFRIYQTASGTVDRLSLKYTGGIATIQPQDTAGVNPDPLVLGGSTITLNTGIAGAAGDRLTVGATGLVTLTDDLTVTGGDITLGTTSIFSGGDTASLNNIDVLNPTTEATIEAAIDTLANLTSASALATVGTITTGVWNGTDVPVTAGGTGASDAPTARTNLGLGSGDSPTFSGLTLTSTTGSLLINRMTTTQRDALTPVNGIEIYNTTTNQFEFYQNGAWTSVTGVLGTGIDNRYGLFNGTGTLEGGLLSDDGTDVSLASGDLILPSDLIVNGTMYGGSTAGLDVKIVSTSHASKGKIFLGNSTDFIYDEANTRLSLGGETNTITIGGSSLGNVLTIHNSGGANDNEVVVLRHNNSDHFSFVSARSQGTIGSPTIVSDDDIVLEFIGVGYDGVDYEHMAAIHLEIDGAPSTTSMPGRIVLKTTPVGSTTLTERWFLNSDGSIYLMGVGGGSFERLKLQHEGSTSGPITWTSEKGTGGAVARPFKFTGADFGIGVTPTALLHVGSTTTSDGILLENTSGAGGSLGIYFEDAAGNSSTIRNDASGNMVLATGAGFGTTRLKIDSSNGSGMFGTENVSETLLGTSVNTAGHEGVSLHHDGTEAFIYSVDSGAAWHPFTVSALEFRLDLAGTADDIVVTPTNFALTMPLELENTTTTADGRVTFDRTNEDLSIGDGSASQIIHMGAWKTWTPTFGGFSVDPSSVIARYTQVGKAVSVWVSMGNGTSNATTFTMTLPLAADSAGRRYHALAQVVNNGSFGSTPGLLKTIVSSTTADLYLDGAQTAWTNVGGKRANFSFTYEAN